MKIKRLIAVACAAAMLTACGSTGGEKAENQQNNPVTAETTNQEPKTEGLKVVTSTYILRDLAQEIIGDKSEVTCLIPKGQGVHGFEPSPKDMNRLNDADVFIYNGAGLESFTDSLQETVKGDGVFVEASKGIELLKGGHHHHDEDGDPHDADHDKGEHHNDANHENHAEEAHEHEHEHDGKDPHVWMSPENADKMAKNIADALAAKDPDNAQFYQDNYAKTHEKFEALDDAFKSALSQVKHKDIVVSHEAYGYLAKEFGLNQIPIEGINSESEPDPKAMKEIIDLMKTKGIQTVFTEPNEDDKIARTIASEAGAQVKELDPMEYESDQNYFRRMESNLKILESALQ